MENKDDTDSSKDSTGSDKYRKRSKVKVCSLVSSKINLSVDKRL